MVATTRMLFAQPSNIWILSTAMGRAPLRETADDLLKLALLYGMSGSARVASSVESATKTLSLVTEPAGVVARDSQSPEDGEVNHIVWDNSAVSDYLLAPVAFGRRLKVYLGAGGVHEFTAIEALPSSARETILRRLRQFTHR
jgi:hypothetical protein